MPRHDKAERLRTRSWLGRWGCTASATTIAPWSRSISSSLGVARVQLPAQTGRGWLCDGQEDCPNTLMPCRGDSQQCGVGARFSGRASSHEGIAGGERPPTCRWHCRRDGAHSDPRMKIGDHVNAREGRARALALRTTGRVTVTPVVCWQRTSRRPTTRASRDNYSRVMSCPSAACGTAQGQSGEHATPARKLVPGGLAQAAARQGSATDQTRLAVSRFRPAGSLRLPSSPLTHPRSAWRAGGRGW